MSTHHSDILITRQAFGRDDRRRDGGASARNRRHPARLPHTKPRCGHPHGHSRGSAEQPARLPAAPPPSTSPIGHWARRCPARGGYVGEWHTHPADIGPSRTDLRALAAIARLAQGPVALVVLADPAQGLSHVYGRVAICQDIWPVAAINPVQIDEAEVAITEDTAASLEAEATALTTRESS